MKGLALVALLLVLPIRTLAIGLPGEIGFVRPQSPSPPPPPSVTNIPIEITSAGVIEETPIGVTEIR